MGGCTPRRFTCCNVASELCAGQRCTSVFLVYYRPDKREVRENIKVWFLDLVMGESISTRKCTWQSVLTSPPLFNLCTLLGLLPRAPLDVQHPQGVSIMAMRHRRNRVSAANPHGAPYVAFDNMQRMRLSAAVDEAAKPYCT